MTEATPTPAPPRIRKTISRNRPGDSPAPIAEMKKSTAATFIVNKRPNRSANRPAVIAPAAAPSRAEATAKPNAVAPTWNWSAIADTAPLMTALS